MPYVLYDPATGAISSSGSLSLLPDVTPLPGRDELTPEQVVKNQNNAATLQRDRDRGLEYLETDDFVGGDTHKVNIETGLLEQLPPPPPPPPDPLAQLIAALIKKGVVEASDFHEDTIAVINMQFDRVSMQGVEVASATK